MCYKAVVYASSFSRSSFFGNFFLSSVFPGIVPLNRLRLDTLQEMNEGAQFVLEAREADKILFRK